MGLSASTHRPHALVYNLELSAGSTGWVAVQQPELLNCCLMLLRPFNLPRVV